MLSAADFQFQSQNICWGHRRRPTRELEKEAWPDGRLAPLRCLRRFDGEFAANPKSISTAFAPERLTDDELRLGIERTIAYTENSWRRNVPLTFSCQRDREKS